MRRLAVLSLHTSPLAQPGQGDSGGMNVYVREMVSALAQRGVQADVFTRRWADGPEIVEVEPGFRVVHIEAGPLDSAKEQLPDVVEVLPPACGLTSPLAAMSMPSTPITGCRGWQAINSNTNSVCPWCPPFTPWPGRRRRPVIPSLSGGCGPRLPSSAAPTPSWPMTSRRWTSWYGSTVPIHSASRSWPPPWTTPFSLRATGWGARQALAHLKLEDGPVLLFVGRIQPLKGLDVAVRALAALERPDATLVIVGGSSGVDGGAEVERIHRLAADLGMAEQLRFIEPVSHHLLSTYYRAADVVLVPSRSESFGLVALEAAACGTPVVAAPPPPPPPPDVGGLRTLVEHGRTGFLVEGRDPAMFAARAGQILRSPGLAAEFSERAARRAQRYTWSTAAARLRRVYSDITARTLVDCR